VNCLQSAKPASTGLGSCPREHPRISAQYLAVFLAALARAGEGDLSGTRLSHLAPHDEVLELVDDEPLLGDDVFNEITDRNQANHFASCTIGIRSSAKA